MVFLFNICEASRKASEKRDCSLLYYYLFLQHPIQIVHLNTFSGEADLNEDLL